MAGCLDNAQLPNMEGCVELGERRNKVASIAAGVLFFSGWWFAIDAAAVHPEKAELKDVFQICGVFGTLSFFMVNAVSNGQLRGEAYTTGCLGLRGARVWFFFGFLLGFGSLIGACWILFGEYVTNSCYLFDVNYLSTDVQKNTTAIVQDCQAMCGKQDGCNFFSWNSTDGKCHMKGSTGATNNSAYGVISGPKVCGDLRTFHPTIMYPGVAIFMQNVLIFAASLVYKFGRSEDLWG